VTQLCLPISEGYGERSQNCLFFRAVRSVSSRSAELLSKYSVKNAEALFAYIVMCMLMYKGADKSLAQIDNSYMKIKHISCLSSLYRFLRACSKHILFDLSGRLASSDTIDWVLGHREIGRAKDLSAPRVYDITAIYRGHRFRDRVTEYFQTVLQSRRDKFHILYNTLFLSPPMTYVQLTYLQLILKQM